MRKLYKKFFIVALSLCCMAGTSFGLELSATVPVTQTSDTAVKAKIVATDLARRQILFDILSQYAPREELNGLIYNSSDDELTDLVASTSVSNEQISSDTYSANITMVLDNYAVKKWLDEKGLRNWIPLEEIGEKFTVLIVVPNGLADWAELKRITRGAKVEIETQYISGNQILAKMPLNYQSGFVAAVREAGWKYTNNGGVLQVWK